MFSWTLCVSVCDTLCLWVCLVVWKKRKKHLRKSKETLNSLEGVFLWKGMLFSTPSQTPSTSISLSFSVSLPNTQSGRRSETDLKEEKKNQQAARQFASLSVPHTQTWGRSAKNGTDFTYFWNCWWTKHGKFFCTKPKEAVWRGLPGPKNDKTFCFVEEKLLQTW